MGTHAEYSLVERIWGIRRNIIHQIRKQQYRLPAKEQRMTGEKAERTKDSLDYLCHLEVVCLGFHHYSDHVHPTAVRHFEDNGIEVLFDGMYCKHPGRQSGANRIGDKIAEEPINENKRGTTIH